MTGRNYLAPNATVIIQESKILKTVVDIGPLTIEYVKSARGKRGYSFYARTCKRGDDADLHKIWQALGDRLLSIGYISKHERFNYDKYRTYQKAYRETHRTLKNEKAKTYYRQNRDEILSQMRLVYAQKRALKVAMQRE